MGAPSSTKWGSIVTGSGNPTGRQGRIGIYTSVTNTNTQTTVNVQVWFWTIYSCDDYYCTLYYNAGTNVTSATTAVVNNCDIKHTVASGTGWSTSNQTKLYEKTYTYTRGTSATTYKVYAKFNGIDMLDSAMYANTSYTVPKLASYTVSYNANGGSGVPSSQTKWYGKTLTLSSTKPTRTGYSFQGWATSASGGVVYAAGGSYTANATATLYAVWKANTYTVKYDANGGSGAPGNQTKTYGKTLTLSSTKPTRTNYNFLGWATSASATTVAYKPGGSYTTNAGITLYAVWELAYVKPRITNLSIGRCNRIETDDVTYEPSDNGTYVLISFDWVCDREVSSIEISLEAPKSTISTSPSASGTSGSVDEILSDVDAETTFTVSITVTDEVDYTTDISTLPGSKYSIDLLPEDKGIAFGKVAELEDVCDIGFQTRFFGGILHMYLEPETDLDDVRTPNVYVGANVSSNQYKHCPLVSGTFSLEVIGMGEDGQVKQRLTYCHKTDARIWERIYYGSTWNYDEDTDPTGGWVCVSDFNGQLLWSGGKYMTSGHTAELSEPVSKQRSGIVLVFSLYQDGSAKNQEMFEFFVPKYTIQAHSGSGRNFNLCGMFRNGVKYLYLYDDKIVGNDKNNLTLTVGGITYDNSGYVLRYVIGV